MKKSPDRHPEWVTRGKSIQQLIKELQSFEDPELEVRISTDGGKSHNPISLVGKKDGHCLLINYEDDSIPDTA